MPYGSHCVAWFLIGAAVVGGIINVADNWGRIDNVWQGIGCFVIGAASGVGYGCLTMTPVGLIQGIGWGAATGGMMEGLRCGLNNVVFGESFAEGFWDGAPRGMLFGAIFGGVSGYVNAKMYDCNWLNGKPLNSSYVKAEKILQSYDVEGRKPQIEPINPKESVVPDPKIVKYKQGMAEAYQKYPNKAGKIEYHHVIPKYILGYDNGVVVPIDAAYHQLITNEFRLRWGYGKGYIKDNEYLEQIIREVYDKYPLSPFD